MLYIVLGAILVILGAAAGITSFFLFRKYYNNLF